MFLEQLADRVSAAVWNLHPQWAVAVGKHEYDGQVPDLLGAAVESGLARLARLREQLAGLKAPTPEQEWERVVLLGVVDRERFEGETTRRWQRDAAWYLEPLDVSVYLERDYAPAGLRLERAAAVLGEAGALLEAARQNLDPGLPGAWAERAAAAARRRAGGLVAQVERSPAGRAAPEEAAWVREAAQYAAGELQGYADWLDGERLPGAAAGFSLGPEGLEEWLRASEGLQWAAGDLAVAGAAVLEEDLGSLASLEASGMGPSGVPLPDPVAALRRAVAEARRFAQEKGLLTLPADSRLQVAAGYRLDPGEAGWLQAPGPYDDPATPPVLYVASGETGLESGMLDDLAVAGAFPGRLLQVLAASRVPAEARRRFPSRAFEEGWALYGADLMGEAGYGAVRPQWRRAALHRAVREDCRLVCVAGLHGGSMALDEAQRVFVAEARLGAPAARQEALLCAADPGRAAGGLGRVAFRRLRRRRAEPGGEPSRAFHDGLLALGAVPVGLLDRLAP